MNAFLKALLGGEDQYSRICRVAFDISKEQMTGVFDKIDAALPGLDERRKVFVMIMTIGLIGDRLRQAMASYEAKFGPDHAKPVMDMYRQMMAVFAMSDEERANELLRRGQGS